MTQFARSMIPNWRNVGHPVISYSLYMTMYNNVFHDAHDNGLWILEDTAGDIVMGMPDTCKDLTI